MRPSWGDKYREADRQGAMGAERPHSRHWVPRPAEASHQDVGARYLSILQSELFGREKFLYIRRPISLEGNVLARESGRTAVDSAGLEEWMETGCGPY